MKRNLNKLTEIDLLSDMTKYICLRFRRKSFSSPPQSQRSVQVCVYVCSYACVCNRIQQGGRDYSSTRLLDGQQGDFHLDNVTKQLSIDLLMATNVGRISGFKITNRLSSLIVPIVNHYVMERIVEKKKKSLLCLSS